MPLQKTLTFRNIKPSKMKIKLITLLIGSIIVLTSFQQATSLNSSNIEKGMIKITLLYASGDGKTFDMDYYENKHMPMVASLLGDAMKGFAIDKGIAGRTPDEAVPYLAIGYLYFEQLSDYQEAFGPNAEKIRNDIPNYTNSIPTVQISEVVK